MLPEIYRKQSGNLNFNFDWFDYAAGAGYKRFYPCGAGPAAGVAYFLSSKLIDTSNQAIYLSVLNGTLDKDFDITFSNPCYINASDAIVNFTIKKSDAAAVGHATFNVYHANAAAAETLLGTAVSGDNNMSYERVCLKIPLTAHSIGIGEKLRINIILVSGAGNISLLYLDPNSGLTLTETTSGRTIHTDCTVDIPFKVNL